MDIDARHPVVPDEYVSPVPKSDISLTRGSRIVYLRHWRSSRQRRSGTCIGDLRAAYLAEREGREAAAVAAEAAKSAMNIVAGEAAREEVDEPAPEVLVPVGMDDEV